MPRLCPADSAKASHSTSGIESSASSLPSHMKKRISPSTKDKAGMSGIEDNRQPLLDSETADEDSPRAEMAPTTWAARNQWILLALASGGCAAFNGVFAKLTTTELTSTFSQALARLFGLSGIESAIEFIVRCIFFGLNLVFNGVMWALFTKALARGDSTTQVSIMNTSSNFFITAVLGFVIFSESLPPLWWLGAAMLVAGNVIIGRKDESVKAGEEVQVGDDYDDDASSVASLAEDGMGTHRPFPLVASRADGVAPEKDDDEDILDLELDEMRPSGQ
ncbi:hypothetical protein B0T25DRAFT_543213 [Lasiosphaeria hispida]|uniref:Transmembrane protein 42 n=1 Tax=Lasiosphaeria hispida TaxID=260671 RepID=A0AAJ0HIB2_9PEZI|nr:hypothetical protein B0T25DRAFT_543213 [Lasiosphaeria hispida]